MSLGCYTVHHHFQKNKMHIKYRGLRAMLYRSTWIKKGAEGNSHGFSRQTFVASLPVNSISLPGNLTELLSAAEAGFLEKNLLTPARFAAEALRTQFENDQRDPLRRLDEAAKLVREAAALSADAVVPHVRIKAIADALSTVKSLGGSTLPSAPRQEAQKSDPLAEALKAVRMAAKAVRDGHYGHAPVDGARRSKPYEIWMEISRDIDGTSGPDGLLRALQSCGWVKVRGAVAR
jgi:hypothetical protein